MALYKNGAMRSVYKNGAMRSVYKNGVLVVDSRAAGPPRADVPQFRTAAAHVRRRRHRLGQVAARRAGWQLSRKTRPVAPDSPASSSTATARSTSAA